MSRNTFFLKPVAPFRLDLTAWTLRRRAHNLIDRWDGDTYRRVLALTDETFEIAVTQTQLPESPQIGVTIHGAPLTPRRKRDVTTALERLLGLRIDLAAFYRLASTDADLKRLVQRFRGMKPPRFLTVFEGVVNAIANQQVTLMLGIRLLNLLAEHYGRGLVREDGGTTYAFPRPVDLVDLKPDTLRQLGFSRQKGRAMIESAKNSGQAFMDRERLTALSDDEAIADLCQLHGVGRWSAEYVLLRTLGRLHVFPGDDVGARNGLQRWLGLEKPLDYEAVDRVLSRWQAFKGMIYFHLLLDGLADEGHLPA